MPARSGTRGKICWQRWKKRSRSVGAQVSRCRYPTTKHQATSSGQRSGRVGSDGRALAPAGVLGLGKLHPRRCGTFPRVLGRDARDEAVIISEEAVRKMTSLPARRLGITDRGILMSGMRAGITIFDPAKVINRATFTDTHRYQAGIEKVIANGRVGVEKGEHKRVLAGQILRKRAIQ